MEEKNDILIRRELRITGKKAKTGDRVVIPLADGNTVSGTIVCVNGKEKTVFPDEIFAAMPFELVSGWLKEKFPKMFPEDIYARFKSVELPSWGQLFGHDYGRYKYVSADNDNEIFPLAPKDRIGILDGHVTGYWMRNDTGWIFTEHHSWTYVDNRGEPEFGDWKFFHGVRPVITLI